MSYKYKYSVSMYHKDHPPCSIPPSIQTYLLQCHQNFQTNKMKSNCAAIQSNIFIKQDSCLFSPDLVEDTAQEPNPTGYFCVRSVLGQ